MRASNPWQNDHPTPNVKKNAHCTYQLGNFCSPYVWQKYQLSIFLKFAVSRNVYISGLTVVILATNAGKKHILLLAAILDQQFSVHCGVHVRALGIVIHVVQLTL